MRAFMRLNEIHDALMSCNSKICLYLRENTIQWIVSIIIIIIFFFFFDIVLREIVNLPYIPGNPGFTHNYLREREGRVIVSRRDRYNTFPTH